jgi:hypothetical protein
MDSANINTQKFGTIIQSSEKTKEQSNWCDRIVVIGSTIVNNTINDFLIGKPVFLWSDYIWSG